MFVTGLEFGSGDLSAKGVDDPRLAASTGPSILTPTSTPGSHDQRIHPDRKKRADIRQLKALGYKSPSNPPPDQHPHPSPVTHRFPG